MKIFWQLPLNDKILWSLFRSHFLRLRSSLISSTAPVKRQNRMFASPNTYFHIDAWNFCLSCPNILNSCWILGYTVTSWNLWFITTDTSERRAVRWEARKCANSHVRWRLSPNHVQIAQKQSIASIVHTTITKIACELNLIKFEWPVTRFLSVFIGLWENNEF